MKHQSAAPAGIVTDSMKRVLLITDIAFWTPGVGSHARILTLCQQLARAYHVTVFFFGSLYASRRREIENASLDARVVSYKEFEERGKALTPKSTFPRLATLSKWRHDTYVRSLQAFCEQEQCFDIAIVEYLRLGYVADALPQATTTILDTHDLMAHREYRFQLHGARASISLTMQEEIAILSRFDAVLAIQHEEADALQRMLPNRIVLCCPHGIEVNDIPAPALGSGTLRLGFVGADSVANHTGIDWFIRSVWPIVERLPLELHVFGSVCSRLETTAQGVKLHGFVAEPREAYSECHVMLNPVIFGGGLKIKSIESLGYGRPLIASPEGAVGIRSPENSGVLLARGRSEYVNHILDLLLNRDRLHRLSELSLAAAQAQFSPSAASRQLIDFVEAL